MPFRKDFVRKLLCSPRSAANAAAEWELGRTSRRGKMFVI
jgi:hypothetical protein